MDETDKLFKIKNRLQMMYGSCKVISSSLALAYDGEYFKLFTLLNGGAKEISCGCDLQVYDDLQILVLYNKGIANIHNFLGDSIEIPKCDNVERVGENGLKLTDSTDYITNYREYLIRPNGDILLGQDYNIIEIEGYSNGIVEYAIHSMKGLYNLTNGKRVQSRFDPEQDTQGMVTVTPDRAYLYEVPLLKKHPAAPRFTEATPVGTAYTIDLDVYGEIQAFDYTCMTLTNGEKHNIETISPSYVDAYRVGIMTDKITWQRLKSLV